jgi:hypothetical protein
MLIVCNGLLELQVDTNVSKDHTVSIFRAEQYSSSNPWYLPQLQTALQPRGLISTFMSLLTKANNWSLFTRPTIGLYPESDGSSPHPVFMINFNIVLPFMSRFPSGVFHSGFLAKTAYIYHIPYACYMPCPSLPSSLAVAFGNNSE